MARLIETPDTVYYHIVYRHSDGHEHESSVGHTTVAGAYREWDRTLQFVPDQVQPPTLVGLVAKNQLGQEIGRRNPE